MRLGGGFTVRGALLLCGGFACFGTLCRSDAPGWRRIFGLAGLFVIEQARCLRFSSFALMSHGLSGGCGWLVAVQ